MKQNNNALFKQRCYNFNLMENKVQITIENIGNYGGEGVILLYWIPENAGKNGLPLKRLVGFERSHYLEHGNYEVLTLYLYQEFIISNEFKYLNGQWSIEGLCQS